MISRSRPVEQVIRSVAAAQGHDGAGVRIGESRVQIGEALIRSSGKVERPVLERVLAWLGRKAERASASQAELDALRLRR